MNKNIKSNTETLSVNILRNTENILTTEDNTIPTATTIPVKTSTTTLAVLKVLKATTISQKLTTTGLIKTSKLITNRPTIKAKHKLEKISLNSTQLPIITTKKKLKEVYFKSIICKKCIN